MKTNNKKVEDKFYGKRVVKGIFAKTWSGKSAKLNKYGDYAIVAADDDGNAKTFANRTQAQNFSDRNNLGGVKEPSGGGRSFFVYIKDLSSEEKKTLSRTGAKAKFANKDINLKIASLRSKILKLNELLQNAKETENTQEFARLVQKIKIEEKNLKVAYDVANLYGGI